MSINAVIIYKFDHNNICSIPANAISGITGGGKDEEIFAEAKNSNLLLNICGICKTNNHISKCYKNNHKERIKNETMILVTTFNFPLYINHVMEVF